MQLVRCEQCGAKALIAASQCPRCAHAFFLRDSRGETVPMGHCNVCDTYYPRSRGGCRWCGTKVSPLPIGLLQLLLGLVLAVAVVAVGVWQYRARKGGGAESEVPAGAVAPDRGAPLAPGSGADSVGSTLTPRSAVGTPLSDSASIPDSTVSDVPSAGGPSAAPSSGAAVAPSAAVAAPGATSDAAAGAGTPRPARDAYTGPWTRAIAQSWVNVRVSASVDGVVVGVVTPNARVELGELRGGWRRVRSAGVQGWADASYFAVDTAGR